MDGLEGMGFADNYSLDTASDFIWRSYAYHADGFFSPSPFPYARPDSQMFNLGDGSKVLNFLLITSPSSLSCLNSSSFSLVKSNPHRVSRQFGLDQDVPMINDTEYDVQEAKRPLLYDSAMDYWCEREVDVLIPCRRREGSVTENMCTYWRRIMNSFVDFVASREQEKVVIGPPKTDIPPNRCLVPNTRAICSWASRQRISFAEWHANLDSWVIYGEDVPIEWRKQNRVVEAPEPKIEERKIPSKRTHNGTPPTGSVARRTRSKVEHDVGSIKKDKFESPVIELHDSPVRDTSFSLTTPAVENASPPLVLTTGIVPFLSPYFEARTYRRKTTAHKMKIVIPDECSSGEVNS